MDLVATAINAAVIAAVTILLGLFAKSRFEEVNRRLDDFREDVNRRFEAVDRRFEDVDRRFDDVNLRVSDFQRSLDSMRSDVTAIAMAVGARPQTEAGGGP